MPRLARAIEVAANLLIILVALGAIAVVTQKLSGAPESHRVVRPSPGTRLSVPGIDWSTADATLVLALDRKCPYCRDGAPFYRQLLEATKIADAQSGSRMRLVAIMPEPVPIIRDYLGEIELSIAEVVSVRDVYDVLDGGRVPTLVLVGSDGVVKRSWLGRLTPESENEVLALLSD